MKRGEPRSGATSWPPGWVPRAQDNLSSSTPFVVVEYVCRAAATLPVPLIYVHGIALQLPRMRNAGIPSSMCCHFASSTHPDRGGGGGRTQRNASPGAIRTYEEQRDADELQIPLRLVSSCIHKAQSLPGSYFWPAKHGLVWADTSSSGSVALHRVASSFFEEQSHSYRGDPRTNPQISGQ
ncbi:hypothetical protein LY76DRAFT_251568 [Colletotrichum caudatum]|nr:hypothetical protein LY76DRAFT_251568 [Colletotrichum caudatum]